MEKWYKVKGNLNSRVTLKTEWLDPRVLLKT